MRCTLAPPGKYHWPQKGRIATVHVRPCVAAMRPFCEISLMTCILSYNLWSPNCYTLSTASYVLVLHDIYLDWIHSAVFDVLQICNGPQLHRTWHVEYENLLMNYERDLAEHKSNFFSISLVYLCIVYKSNWCHCCFVVAYVWVHCKADAALLDNFRFAVLCKMMPRNLCP